MSYAILLVETRLHCYPTGPDDNLAFGRAVQVGLAVLDARGGLVPLTAGVAIALVPLQVARRHAKAHRLRYHSSVVLALILGGVPRNGVGRWRARNLDWNDLELAGTAFAEDRRVLLRLQLGSVGIESVTHG